MPCYDYQQACTLVPHDSSQNCELTRNCIISGDGVIKFMEFITFMCKTIKNPITDEDIEKCYKVFDTEENGYISIRDLQRVFKSLGQNPTDDELQDMLLLIDPGNEDGLVQLQGTDYYFCNKQNRIKQYDKNYAS